MWRKHVNCKIRKSLGIKKRCDIDQQKQDTDSPMSNEIRVTYAIHTIFLSYAASVYEHVSHFFSQHHHKPKNLNCLSMHRLSVVI